MRFLKKVQEKVARFKEVERLLQDTSVTADQTRLRDLGREFRSLEKISKTKTNKDFLKSMNKTS